MLTDSAASNTSGKSVTTLIRSIGLFHRHEMVAPGLHHRPGRDPLESEQPLPVVGAASRHHQGARHDATLLVHDEQPGFGREDRARILAEGPPPPRARGGCRRPPTAGELGPAPPPSAGAGPPCRGEGPLSGATPAPAPRP